MMLLVSLASADTDDDNNQEADPVYFGFMFGIDSCSDKKPCYDTDTSEDEIKKESESLKTNKKNKEKK